MIADILTVMWKERKALFRARGRRSQTILALATPLLMAIVLPIQVESDWLSGVLSLLLAFFVTLLVVGITIPDAFAGEREHHTLATLLASRLPDRAILIGKAAVCVLLGWGITLAALAVGLVSMNVAHWQGSFRFYTATTLIADVSLSLLLAILVASVGVLFSLRSASVQEAQQTLMAVMMLPAVLMQGVAFVLLGSTSGRERVRAFFSTVSYGEIVLAVAAVLVVLDALLVAMVLARFRRARLIQG